MNNIAMVVWLIIIILGVGGVLCLVFDYPICPKCGHNAREKRKICPIHGEIERRKK